MVQILLALPFILAKPLLAGNFYLSPTGNDGNTGSLEKPWQTISRINQHHFSKGDNIYFQAGEIFQGNLTINIESNPHSSDSLLITSYGSGMATLDAQNGWGIEIKNAGSVSIENLRVIGSGYDANQANGVNIFTDLGSDVRLPQVTLRNLETSGFGRFGISVGAMKDRSGYDGILIEGVHSHHNGLGGISIWGSPDFTRPGYNHKNVVIDASTVDHNPGKPNIGAHSGDGIMLTSVDGGRISRCIAHNNGWRNTANGGPVGIWAWNSRQIIIEHNESHHNQTASRTDGGGFDLDGGVTDSILQYNYSHDNDGAGFLLAQFPKARPFSRNVIRFNVSINDGRKNQYPSIDIWSDDPNEIRDIELYNNTVFNSGSSPTLRILGPSGRQIRIANNLFVTTSDSPLLSVDSGQIDVRFLSNAYWAIDTPFIIGYGDQTLSTLEEFRKIGQESIEGLQLGLEQDPLLMGVGFGFNNTLEWGSPWQFLPQDNSPLLNRGLDLKSVFGLDVGKQDFFGNTITPATPSSIGASVAAGSIP